MKTAETAAAFDFANAVAGMIQSGQPALNASQPGVTPCYPECQLHIALHLIAN
jgi:hypothetical protein